MDVKVGVLALQGDVTEHIAAFREALTERPGSSVVPVRKAADLAGLDALAIPGGESTTISRLIEKNGLYEALREFEGGVFATCAGMVLLAERVDDPRVRPLGLIPMRVERNAFGRQADSREAML
ncbi:MAG TPA: pyridoxal 5'-phosphate synthase glutaminase subunit PdxT, partial [Methanoculleus sp.]|nr:pyridoxal 5'-phosphate synthase glutaminase subunit PdxT [Methanoculleus sp.]